MDMQLQIETLPVPERRNARLENSAQNSPVGVESVHGCGSRGLTLALRFAGGAWGYWLLEADFSGAGVILAITWLDFAGYKLPWP